METDTLRDNTEAVFRIIENQIVNFLRQNGRSKSKVITDALNLGGPCDPSGAHHEWTFGFFYTRLIDQGRVVLYQEKKGSHKEFDIT